MNKSEKNKIKEYFLDELDELDLENITIIINAINDIQININLDNIAYQSVYHFREINHNNYSMKCNTFIDVDIHLSSLKQIIFDKYPKFKFEELNGVRCLREFNLPLGDIDFVDIVNIVKNAHTNAVLKLLEIRYAIIESAKFDQKAIKIKKIVKQLNATIDLETKNQCIMHFTIGALKISTNIFITKKNVKIDLFTINKRRESYSIVDKKEPTLESDLSFELKIKQNNLTQLVINRIKNRCTLKPDVYHFIESLAENLNNNDIYAEDAHKIEHFLGINLNNFNRNGVLYINTHNNGWNEIVTSFTQKKPLSYIFSKNFSMKVIKMLCDDISKPVEIVMYDIESHVWNYSRIKIGDEK